MKEILKHLNVKNVLDHKLIENGEKVTYEDAKNAIRNPDTFAKKIDSSDIEIGSGIRLSSRTIELGEGHFTNIYDLYFDNKSSELSTEIITRRQPIYPHRLFNKKYKDASKKDIPVACINGAFFFLQDEQLPRTPEEIIYNLNMRDGIVLGLPAVDRPALFTTKDGHLHAKEIKSIGVLLLGNKKINWVGGESLAHHKSNEDFLKNNDAILFNSACCSIEYENPSDKTSLRRLLQYANMTPLRKDVVDVVVKNDDKGRLYISSINPEGGTDFFNGNFILQLKKDTSTGIKVGDSVVLETIDDICFKDLSSALTTGPMVGHFLNHEDHEINHDLSLGSFPPFEPDTRYARSVMYEDKNHYVHMVVFDAVPRSQFMKGVTPKEVAKNIPVDTIWSLFLDGGQSSRITFDKKSGGLSAVGNKQYIRLHERYKSSQNSTGVDDQFLWSSRGRPLSSMIVLRRK